MTAVSELDRFFAPPAVDPGLLDRLPLAHEGRCVQALGRTLAVRSTETLLAGYLEELLAGFPTAPGPPEVRFTVVRRAGLEGADWWSLYADGHRLATADSPYTVARCLVEHVNTWAREVDGAIPLHAGVVACDGRAALVAAPSGTGKSTLVAGLCARGMAYASDEVALVDPDSLAVRPYAKPLELGSGSWAAVPELEPPVPPGLEDLNRWDWLVPVGRLPGGHVTSPLPVGLVVRPAWRAGADARVTRASRAETLVALATDAFRPRHHIPAQLDGLARLLRDVPCVRLEYGDLDDALTAVRALLVTGQDHDDR